MAVIKMLTKFHGHEFCVLVDGDADSVEVVFEAGYRRDDVGEEIEFLPSYYEEQPTGGKDFFMVRRVEDTHVPVGIMAEHVSRKRKRKGLTALEQIEFLLLIARRTLPSYAEQTESLLPAEAVAWALDQVGRVTLPQLKLNGERLVG